MSQEKRPNLYLLLLLTLVVFAFLSGLGVWQVQRLDWKQGLIARIEARVQRQPISLKEVSDIWIETGDVEYLPVRLAGAFLHERELHLYSLVDGEAGWEVITPFVTEAGTVLVNRGFVPEPFKSADTRRAGQIRGEVSITGLVRETGIQGNFVPDNDVAANMWFWRSLRGMSLAAGIAEREMLGFYVDMKSPAPPGAMPRPGITRLEIPNKHLWYAITWFALAGVLIIIVALFVRKTFGRRHDAA